VNVMTVEDPVEKRIDGVNQTQINNKAGMTFPSALRSILRSDPDIVMIGEIRDKETATIAVEASLTGHLVLSTLHTNGSPESLTRLVEMGVEPYLVSTSVAAIVAQRLARKLCEKCKALITVDPVLREKVEFPVATATERVYGPVGCNECSNTGYRGRVAVVEIMAVTEGVERLVLEGASASVIRKHANFKSLREDGFRRVLLGDTTIEEVMRVTL
jgi:type IV pilus assembly protein PilB